MKLLYKIILFFAFFQMMVLIINSLGVFPHTLYDDMETSKYDFDSPEEIFGYLFLPNGEVLGISYDEPSGWTVAAIVLIFVGIGSAFAWATHSWTPVIITLLGISFFPMLINSLGFFNKILFERQVVALEYMALLIGLGIVLIIIFSIIETPTHGDV